MIVTQRGIGRRRSIGGKSNTITLETRETKAYVHIQRKKHVGISCNIDGWVKHVSKLKAPRNRSSGDSHVSGKCVLTTSWDTILEYDDARDKLLRTL